MPEFDVASALKAGYKIQDIADEIGMAAGYDVNAARDAGFDDLQIVNYLNSRLAKESVVEEMGTGERFAAGIGRGMLDVPQGIKQAALDVGETVGVLEPGTTQSYTREIFGEEQQYDQPLMETTSGQAGRMVGQAAATAPLTLGRPATVPGRIAVGGVEGAIAGAALPVPEGGSRLEQAAYGGLGGAAGAGVLEAGGAAYKGVRGDKAARYSTELSGLANNAKVDLTVGELRNSPTLKKIEVLLENVPIVGTGSFRKRQAASVLQSAKALSQKYGQVDDAGEFIQQGLLRAEKEAKRQAGELYDQVGELASDSKFSLNNTKQVASDFLSEEQILPKTVQDKDTIELMQKYIDMEDVDFATARKIRSRIGKLVRQAEKKEFAGSVSPEYVARLKQVYSALENDIGDFAEKQGGELYDSYRTAQNFFRENVVPFTDKQIRKASQEYDTDGIVNMFVKNDRPKNAAKLMERLDPRSQNAVRHAVMEKMFENAYDSQRELFSPAKFATSIDKLGKTADVVFGREGAIYLRGYGKLMRAAERAGQFMENPPTGNRVVQAAVLGAGSVGVAFDPATVLSIAGSSALMTKLLTTNFGRRVLARASRVKEGSKAWQRIIGKDIPRAIALANAEEQRQQEFEQMRSNFAGRETTSTGEI